MGIGVVLVGQLLFLCGVYLFVDFGGSGFVVFWLQVGVFVEYVDVQVDVIEQWFGQFVLVVLDLFWGVVVVVIGIVEVVIGIGIYCCYQLEVCWEMYLVVGLGNDDFVVFQWFVQDFQDFVFEFWQFVEEQYVLVCQGDFVWLWVVVVVDQGWCGGGVVWLVEWLLWLVFEGDVVGY